MTTNEPSPVPERDVTKEPFSAHEALDRAYIAQQFFSEWLAQNRFVQAIPELREAAEDLGERLAGFYQLVGKHSLEVK